MQRQPHLNAIEGLQAAINCVNKASSVILTYKTARILISLYNATERGRVITKRGLLDRLQRLNNVEECRLSYQAIWRLIRDGFIEQEGKGMGVAIRLSVAGRNYVKGIERYLRHLRLSEY